MTLLPRIGKQKKVALIVLVLLISLVGCDDSSWNNPHSSHDTNNIRYSSFSESPKTLDPARAYSSDESLFTAQVYEPVLQYHYLKRPYTLVPLTAAAMPKVSEKNGYTIYDIYIKPGIKYQPHPAFAKDEQGAFYYQNLTEEDLEDVHDLSDFKHVGTRELIAEDYVYEIKRLAHPALNSPILAFMEKYIDGLTEYARTLQKVYDKQIKENPESTYLDLRKFSLKGVRVISRYHYRITLKGKYPQFHYWLAMPFFSPIPWEADHFYSQAGMDDHNLSFDWYPVGTGPYMLTENNPNKQMVLMRNPNFHGETYPAEGEPEDKAMGFLQDAGKPLPFIDKVVFSLEKESIPRWNKFLQGYYDLSSIGSDSFDQAIYVDKKGNAQLTAAMKAKHLRLQTSVSPAIYYLGFNMLDDVVGGSSERARKLRQAISLAIDYEEFIAIFLNGRGTVAQGPIPPGIFGFSTVNAPPPYALDTAKRLLAEAGYPKGRDPKTGKALILYYDVPASTDPGDKARFAWMRKQFDKLGIQLQVRGTQYNRFQEKMRTGNAQIFSWGWIADYPDPENFLFLLYGENSKVKHSGENASNYHNPKFDRLFEAMKDLPNGPARQEIIDKMLTIVRHDAPWVWGFYAKDFVLTHSWNRLSKVNVMANNTLKYQRLDPELRDALRKEWNNPEWWPFVVLFGLLLLVVVVVFLAYWRKEHKLQRKR